jgi:antitoxin component YwqK of YwqJK toxin-antitoxin module
LLKNLDQIRVIAVSNKPVFVILELAYILANQQTIKMKNLILPLFLFMSQIAFGQIETLEKEVPQAIVCRAQRFRLVNDCDGMVYSEKRMIADREEDIVFHQRSGKPYTGRCKVCHNNGNLWMYLNFHNGRSKGLDTVWYDDGKIELVRAHDEEGSGLENGLWKYYRPDGSLKWEKNYVDGMANGEHRHYFEDSTLQKIEIWDFDRLNGKKQEFFQGGQIKKEVDYKNGEWHGTYITYFEDGKVESEQQYVNGKKEGPSTYYFEGGDIFYTENHSNDLREGEFKRFYRSTKRFTVENYKNDQRHGLFQEYYDDEKNYLKYEATYKNGEIVVLKKAKKENPAVLDEHYYDEFGDEVGSPGGKVVEGGDDAAKKKDKKEKKKKDKKKKDKENKKEEEEEQESGGNDN